MDIWRNIPGNNLTALLSDPRYPDKPSTSNKVPKLASPPDIENNYGLLLKTYYVVSCLELYRPFSKSSLIFSLNECRFYLSFSLAS